MVSIFESAFLRAFPVRAWSYSPLYPSSEPHNMSFQDLSGMINEYPWVLGSCPDPAPLWPENALPQPLRSHHERSVEGRSSNVASFASWVFWHIISFCIPPSLPFYELSPVSIHSLLSVSTSLSPLLPPPHSLCPHVIPSPLFLPSHPRSFLILILLSWFYFASFLLYQHHPNLIGLHSSGLPFSHLSPHIQGKTWTATPLWGEQGSIAPFQRLGLGLVQVHISQRLKNLQRLL